MVTHRYTRKKEKIYIFLNRSTYSFPSTTARVSWDGERTTTKIWFYRMFFPLVRGRNKGSRVDRTHKIHRRMFDLSLIHNRAFSTVYFYNPLSWPRPCRSPSVGIQFRKRPWHSGDDDATAPPHRTAIKQVTFFNRKGCDVKKMHTTKGKIIRKKNPIISPTSCVCFIRTCARLVHVMT